MLSQMVDFWRRGYKNAANLTQGNNSHKYDLYERKGILAANQMDINAPWTNLALKLEHLPCQ